MRNVKSRIKVPRRALVMNSRGRMVPDGVPLRYTALSFREVILVSASPRPLGQQTQTLNFPAPSGYSAVSIGLASVTIGPSSGQGGLPGAKGVTAAAWIQSTTPSRVTIGYDAEFLTADDRYEQDGVIYALLTFYFTN